MKANGIEEVSCVEKAQELYDDLREKNYSDEILNNAMQLLKKIQTESKELSNVPDVDEEDYEEESEEEESESMPDYDKMPLDEMKQDMKKKGMLTITVVTPKSK